MILDLLSDMNLTRLYKRRGALTRVCAPPPNHSLVSQRRPLFLCSNKPRTLSPFTASFLTNTHTFFCFSADFLSRIVGILLIFLRRGQTKGRVLNNAESSKEKGLCPESNERRSSGCSAPLGRATKTTPQPCHF